MATTPAGPESASPPRQVRPLGHQAARGFAWLMAQSMLTKVIGLVGQIVLAMLLLPDDYGKIGLAYTVAAFANLIANPGIDDVLVQRQTKIRRWIGPAFSLALACGLLGSCFMLAAAPISGLIYRKATDLPGLIAILAIAPPLSALAVTPNAMLRASLRFRFLALQGLVQSLTLNVLTVLFAWMGMGSYSFAWPVPIATAVITAMSWLAARPKIPRHLWLRRWPLLLGDSFYLFMMRLLNVALAQGDYIILGLMYIPAVVGIYVFGFQFAMQGLSFIAGNFTGALFPSLSKLHHDPERHVNALLRATQLLCYATASAGFMQAALARPVMVLLYGERWVGAIPVVQLLSIGIGVGAACAGGPVFAQSRGEFKRHFLVMCRIVPFFFILVAVGAWHYGILGAAWGAAIYCLIFPLVSFYVLLRPGDVTFARITRILTRPLAICGIAAVLGFLAGKVSSNSLGFGPLPEACVIALVGGGLMLALMRLFDFDILKEILRYVVPRRAAG